VERFEEIFNRSDDAGFMIRIPATVLVDLNQYEAVVKLLVSGTKREPFGAKMLPLLENRVGRRDKLIALSRELFAMPRAKIKATLRRWMDAR
jgi:hypothetical protein